jgi:hypothetical protein
MFFKDRDTVLFLIVCDSLCSLIFLAEAALKIASGPYFHDSWNRLDFLIALCAVLSPVFRASGIGAGVDACTIVRAFRPLRFINYVPKIKVQVNMLFKSFSSLGTLAVFMGFSMTAYAIAGLQLLKGLYYFCDDGKWEENALYLATVGTFPTNSPRDGLVSDNGLYTARPCSGNYTNSTGFPLEAKGEWVNSLYNFDDFAHSLLSVFILSVVRTNSHYIRRDVLNINV